MKFYPKTFLILSFLFLTSLGIYAQETDVVPYLKLIEDGKRDSVKQILPRLIQAHPNDPSIMFLKGVLTENAQQSVSIYNKIYESYPHSRYADAALYRVYSYYYAVGIYSAAKKYLAALKKNYPNSPYLTIIKNKIPQKDNNIITGNKPGRNPVSENKQIDLTDKLKGDYKFTIQAGAFTVPDNAQSLKKSFIQAGYFSKIEEKNVAGATFHVVYVGRFYNEEDAEKTLKQVNSKYNLDGRVVPLN